LDKLPEANRNKIGLIKKAPRANLPPVVQKPPAFDPAKIGRGLPPPAAETPISALHDQSFDLHLMGNFIHQVVNPLNGVAGTLFNMSKGAIGPERMLQRINSARAQLEQCISLVRNLAYFASGFSELKPTERRAVIVPQVIIEAAQIFQELAENKQMKIDLDNRQDQNKIFGHHELVRQIFANLFDNAVKYGMPGTRVLVHQSVQKRTKHVLVTVSNESKLPISQEDLTKIFDVGFRGTNAKSIIASGTGLGLYICKRICEDVHLGKIWVEGSQNRKITFFLSFPQAE
jgi:signal transduction histidine kinase